MAAKSSQKRRRTFSNSTLQIHTSKIQYRGSTVKHCKLYIHCNECQMYNGNKDKEKFVFLECLQCIKTSQKKNFYPNTLQKYVVKVQRKYSKNTVHCTSTAGPPQPIFGREGFLLWKIQARPRPWGPWGSCQPWRPCTICTCDSNVMPKVQDKYIGNVDTVKKLYYWKVVLFAVCVKTSFEKAKIFLFSTVKHATLSRRKTMFCRRSSSLY